MSNQLKTYLLKNNISITDFSRIINVHHSTLSNYLAGRRIPKMKIMKKIISATGGHVNFLFQIHEEDEVFNNFIRLYIKNNLNVPLKLLANEMDISTSALSQKIHGKISFSNDEIEFLLTKLFEDTKKMMV